jgi:hypothetical protein
MCFIDSQHQPSVDYEDHGYDMVRGIACVLMNSSR